MNSVTDFVSSITNIFRPKNTSEKSISQNDLISAETVVLRGHHQKAFISHCPQDSQYLALLIYLLLRAKGLEVYLGDTWPYYNAPWRLDMYSALDAATVYIILPSDNYGNTPYSQAELHRISENFRYTLLIKIIQ